MYFEEYYTNFEQTMTEYLKTIHWWAWLKRGATIRFMDTIAELYSTVKCEKAKISILKSALKNKIVSNDDPNLTKMLIEFLAGIKKSKYSLKQDPKESTSFTEPTISIHFNSEKSRWEYQINSPNKWGKVGTIPMHEIEKHGIDLTEELSQNQQDILIKLLIRDSAYEYQKYRGSKKYDVLQFCSSYGEIPRELELSRAIIRPIKVGSVSSIMDDIFLKPRINPALYHHWKLRFDVDGRPTNNNEVLKDSWYMFVVMPNNEIRILPAGPPPPHLSYLNCHKIRSHRQIVGSREVLGAGTFRVQNNYIVDIRLNSGHYHATNKYNHLRYVQMLFTYMGADASRFQRQTTNGREPSAMYIGLSRFWRRVSASAKALWIGGEKAEGRECHDPRIPQY